MKFLIEHQYVILYFSGAFFSFFAMLSYVKVGNLLVGGRKKLSSPDEFFDDFDNDDLEALLDESFDVEETADFSQTVSAADQEPGAFAFADESMNIENSNVGSENEIQTDSVSFEKGE